jgi:DNA-binding NarL/FixJ family response regulator
MRRVLLIDDHAVVRDGLRTILEASGRVTVVAEAGAAREGIRRLREHEVDVVILDVSLPDMSGIEALKAIRAQWPRLPVVMFSMHADREYCVRAQGYVLKQSASDDILKAVEAASLRRTWVSPQIAEHLVGVLVSGGDGRAPHETLSDREFEVLRLIGAGETPTQIAKRLCLSVKTVSTYRTRLLEKLGLENNVQLIRYVVEHGLNG